MTDFDIDDLISVKKYAINALEEIGEVEDILVIYRQDDETKWIANSCPLMASWMLDEAKKALLEGVLLSGD